MRQYDDDPNLDLPEDEQVIRAIRVGGFFLVAGCQVLMVENWVNVRNQPDEEQLPCKLSSERHSFFFDGKAVRIMFAL